MLIQPIDYFLAVWFASAAASTACVAWDQCRNSPRPVVMKWGLILVTFYMGHIGLLLYVLADKEPRRACNPAQKLHQFLFSGLPRSGMEFSSTFP
jgi:hypothetical protein